MHEFFLEIVKHVTIILKSCNIQSNVHGIFPKLKLSKLMIFEKCLPGYTSNFLFGF